MTPPSLFVYGIQAALIRWRTFEFAQLVKPDAR